MKSFLIGSSLALLSTIFMVFFSPSVLCESVQRVNHIPKVYSMKIVGAQIVIKGENFDNVKTLKLNNTKLDIISSSRNIIVTGHFDLRWSQAGSVMDILISNSYGTYLGRLRKDRMNNTLIQIDSTYSTLASGD